MLGETNVEDQPIRIVETKAIDPSRDEPLAVHEAAHAVAMWKLDFGIGSISIDPDQRTAGYTRAARAYDLESERDRRRRRYMVEQNAIVLQAGSVAEQLPAAGNHGDRRGDRSRSDS